MMMMPWWMNLSWQPLFTHHKLGLVQSCQLHYHSNQTFGTFGTGCGNTFFFLCLFWDFHPQNKINKKSTKTWKNNNNLGAIFYSPVSWLTMFYVWIMANNEGRKKKIARSGIFTLRSWQNKRKRSSGVLARASSECLRWRKLYTRMGDHLGWA